VAQEVTVRLEPGFQLRTGDPGLEGGQAAFFVQGHQPVEPAQVDGQNGGRAGQGVDVADDAGAASEGDETDAVLSGEVQQLAHLGFVAGISDAVGKAAYAAAAKGDPVGQALAAGMAEPVQGAGADQGVSGQSGGGHGGQDAGELGIRPDDAGPQAPEQEGGRIVVQRIGCPGVSPAVPASHGPHSICRQGVRRASGRRNRPSRPAGPG
jgi:hypothetical protein